MRSYHKVQDSTSHSEEPANSKMVCTWGLGGVGNSLARSENYQKANSSGKLRRGMGLEIRSQKKAKSR